MMSERKLFTYGIVVGAGLMFFLDPRQGGARRARVRDKSVRAIHEVEDAAGIGARDMSHRAEGVIARLRRGERPMPSDDVLRERVRSALGRVAAHPHAIRVKALGDGCIELSGPILAADVDDVLSLVCHVRGVDAVENRLEIHETEVGVPALQGEPSRRSRLVRVAPAAKLAAGALAACVALVSIVVGKPLGLLLGGGSVLAIAHDVRAHGSRFPFFRFRRRRRAAFHEEEAPITSRGGDQSYEQLAPSR
jgi:hypothetical protein